jgi:hypothetical protein
MIMMVILSTKFNNKLEYFLAYNKQDTIIMIPTINKLIDVFADQKVDMLKNTSSVPVLLKQSLRCIMKNLI